MHLVSRGSASSTTISPAAGSVLPGSTVTFSWSYTGGGSNGTDVAYKFTGKELDSSTGLYFYEARYYDAVLGRFISADTIVSSATDPQSLNRYTYANNNPIIFTDPSGHFGISFKKANRKFKKWGKAAERWTFKNRAYLTLGHSIAVDRALTDRYIGPYARMVGMAAAAYWGGPWAAAGAQAYYTRLDGGSFGDALKAGAIAYASAYAGQAANQLGAAAGVQYGPYAGSAVRVAGRGLVGGGIASIRGGSFTTGFAFAAGAAFANEAYKAISGWPGISYRPGGDAQLKGPEVPAAIRGAGNIGNAATTQDMLDNPGWLDEGGWGTNILKWVPGVEPTSGFHDPLTGPNFLGMSGATNIPTMLPSYGLTLAGSLDQVWIGGPGGRKVSVSTIILNQRNF